MSRDEGSTTLRLHCETVTEPDLRPVTDRQEIVSAEVVYWDAAGRYFLRTFVEDVPLEAVEALIAEAKELIRCR